MVLILDGNAVIVAQARSNLYNLICLRHLAVSKKPQVKIIITRQVSSVYMYLCIQQNLILAMRYVQQKLTNNQENLILLLKGCFLPLWKWKQPKNKIFETFFRMVKYSRISEFTWVSKGLPIKKIVSSLIFMNKDWSCVHVLFLTTSFQPTCRAMSKDVSLRGPWGEITIVIILCSVPCVAVSSRELRWREKFWLAQRRAGCSSTFSMVFILHGCSFQVAHVWCKPGLFPIKKSNLMTLSMYPNAFNKTKCLIYSMCAHSEMSNHLL